MFDSAVACMLSLALSGPPIVPIKAEGFANLTTSQIEPLRKAHEIPGHLDWRVLTKKVGGRERAIVLLGEVHLATKADLDRAGRVIDQFQDIATENGSTNDDPEWNYVTIPVAALLATPGVILYAISNDAELRSPMKLARTGARVRSVHSVESLHQPTFLEELSLLSNTGVSVVPFLFAGSVVFFLGRVVFGWRLRKPLARLGRTTGNLLIFSAVAISFNTLAGDPLVGGRDPSMAEYIDKWVSDPRNEAPLLVIVGKAHNPGVIKILSEEYGFALRPIDEPPLTRGLPAPHPL